MNHLLKNPAPLLIAICSLTICSRSGPAAPPDLLEAVKLDDLAKVRAEIDAHPDLIESRDKDGGTLLLYAAANGSLKVVKLLVERHASIESEEPGLGFRPLSIAAFQGHSDVVRFLAKAGADMNHKKKDGWSAIMGAASQGRTNTVKCLAELGADLNSQDSNGNIPLMAAATNGHTDTVRELLRLGSSPRAVNKFNRTALMDAAEKGHYYTARLLLASGADPKVVTASGKTATSLAAAGGHRHIIDLLEGGNSSPNPDATATDDMFSMMAVDGKAPQGVKSFAARAVAALNRACNNSQAVSLTNLELDSVSIAGNGTVGDNFVMIERSSPILISTTANSRTFDCGILWSPCAVRKSPAAAFSKTHFTIESVEVPANSAGRRVTVQAPVGPPSLQKISCVPL